MMRLARSRALVPALVMVAITCEAQIDSLAADDTGRALSLEWDKEMLSIRGRHLPGGELSVWYIEAFCRPGSTRRDWNETVIPHKTKLVAASADGRRITLRSELSDGVVVTHEITAGSDEVDFRVVAANPTAVASPVQWAQPCIRVDRYAGVKPEHNSEAYLARCFIYQDGRPVRLPTTPWAREALYIPGQVWCPEGVSRDDVNPRPLSTIVPSSGLIGCVSADGRELVATAWEPYQELFQGVIMCVHSDFRISGLEPGESKTIRGKIYLMPADFPALRARYRRDFPGQERRVHASVTHVPAKKLIEFGWDEPDTAFMRRHLAELEQSPFDGCVFHAVARSASGTPENFAWLGWGRREFKRDDLRQAFDDLAAIGGKTSFQHHFLRFNVTPGELDWFDDYAAVVTNARLAAELARAGHCDGILLDTEAYQGKLFDFQKQRDAKRLSWQQYADQARLRGREVMAALQDGYPGVKVLLTFGHSLVWKRSEGGKKPLAECRDGLLVPFLDGLIDQATRQGQIVDGHELSYGYREGAEFVRARDAITRHVPALAADRPKYADSISVGFGLWLDYDWRKLGWKIGDVEANYFSPSRFGASLRGALEQCDEYVWIYTEKPRWWSDAGKPVDLPQVYFQSVQGVRRACSVISDRCSKSESTERRFRASRNRSTLVQTVERLRLLLVRIFKPLKRPLAVVALWLTAVGAGTFCFGYGTVTRDGEFAAFSASFGIAAAPSVCVALIVAGQRRRALETGLSLATLVVACAAAVYSILWLNSSLVRRFMGYWEFLRLRSFFEFYAFHCGRLYGPLAAILGAGLGLLGGVLIRINRHRPRLAAALTIGILLACASGPVLPAGSRLVTNFVVEARLKHAHAASVYDDEVAAVPVPPQARSSGRSEHGSLRGRMRL